MAAGPKNEYMKQFYSYYENKIKNLEKEHRNEISRLKGQIYILQNAFSEYISFNSINTNYKKRKLRRHLPIFTFFDSVNASDINKTHEALMHLIHNLGFDLYHPEKEPTQYNERMGLSIDDLDLDEVYKRIDHVQELVDDPSKDEKLKPFMESLLKVSTKVKRMSILIGDMIILKIKDEQANCYVLTTRRLSIPALIHIDKNPHLLKNPEQLLNEVALF